MKNYGVVRTDKMTGTKDPAALVSVKYVKGKKDTEIENGHVVMLDGLYEGSREVYKGSDVAANTDLSKVVLIASTETNYETNFDKRLNNLDDFINEAGRISRGYHFVPGNIFSVTKACLDGDPKKDAIVELAAGTKLKAVASATAGSTTVGVIEAVETAGRHTYYAIRVGK